MKDVSYDVQRLLEQRYFQPTDGKKWSNLVNRVVDHVCSHEEKEFANEIKCQLGDRVWLPNSPCLVNSGTKNGGLLACYVVGPDEDTLEHHVDVLGDIAAVGKRGGGCGFSGEMIRAKGSLVAGSAHGYAYGPNAWAVRVSDYLDMITQGGFRKMALMYSLPSDHPDLDEFIDLKQTADERFCYNFNQSVFAKDEWIIDAVIRQNGANDQLKRIVHNMWNNGEPGILFSDTINGNTPYLDPIKTPNPCGEQCLPSYGACVLASINVNHEQFWEDDGTYNINKLAQTVPYIVRFLDNVGSVNVFPNEKFSKWYSEHRPIGIGIMGFADALLQSGIEYGSVASLQFMKEIGDAIYHSAKDESEKLGIERGVPEKAKHVNRRNITLTSVAPTGSIAFLAECSHGIEPIFSPIYQRTDERGQTYIFKHPKRNEKYFKSAINDNESKIVAWKEHIDIQASAQKWIDSAVSKTINMDHDASMQDITRAIVYAWKKGCKGITIYRNGSRQTQVLEDMTEGDILEQDCPTGVCSL